MHATAMELTFTAVKADKDISDVRIHADHKLSSDVMN